MQHALRIKTVSWLAAALSILTGLLLLADPGTAAADGAKPTVFVNPVGPPVAAEAHRVQWYYEGTGVYWFEIEREAPYDKWTSEEFNGYIDDTSARRGQVYRYRVCAIYLLTSSCPDADSDWVSGQLPDVQPPPPPPPPPPSDGGSSGDTSPPPAARPVPQPLHSPVIRARPSRLVPAGPPVVHLAWVNPLDAQQHALLTTVDWYRDGVLIASASTLEYEDAVPANATHRYKLCIENPVNRICSAEISAGPAGVAASLESLNVAGHFIRHRFSLGEIARLTTGLDFADGTFILRPGLTGAPGTVSFESVNYRGQYLRHQNYRIKLSDDDGSELFRQDATFVVHPGLSGTPGTISFESVNFPEHFIRHQNFELWLANKDAGNIMLFPLDVSFRQQLGRAAAP